MHIRLRSLLLPLLLLAVVISVAPPLVTPASAAACHGFSTCPDPKSCGGWSTPLTPCDSPYCDTADSFCEAKGAQLETYQLKEQFRACTLSDGSQCLEWMTFSFRARCGC